MFHEPAKQEDAKDNAIGYKTKIGILMFFFYTFFYAGFVAINIFRPVYMKKIVFAGINLAVAYGFGLIASALLLAMVYNHFCGKKEFKMNR